SVEVFVTARRIVLFVNDISVSRLKDFGDEIKGPNVNVSEGAIEGFLKRYQRSKKDLFIRKVNDKKFYFIGRKDDVFDIREFFKNQLEEMLKNFSWPKSMKWSERKERWVRPIKNILCILNDEIIPVS
ncbi:MAG: glycine--tRNA ligase subunit beta, partial [Wolbachia pipientis]|nr:glycine--tRNA ligase subunit beta [Wolbachia pipientis]